MKNKIFFKIGLFLQLALLAAHLITNRNGLPIPVVDEESRLLTQLMKNYDIHFPGGWRTLDETLWGYDITWALFVLFTFMASIQALRIRPSNRKTGRRLAFANVILWTGALIAALVFWSQSQQIIFGVLLVAFLLSYFLDWKAPKPNETRICVVGAGISGLTVAYQLQKQGYTRVTVLEKEKTIGGKCLSVEYDQHPFDLGGHEMLAGYTDVVEIGEELGSPTQESIPPLIYNHESKQYLNFKKAAVASGKYSMIQVMLASLKYMFLVGVTFRRFSLPSTGFGNMPKELALPLEQWLVKRRLTAMSDILAFVVKVQGYGHFNDTSAAYLVKFMGFKNWVSLLLSGIGISKKWPRIFTYGMFDLCKRMAAGLNVQTGVDISRIERSSDAGSAAVRVYLDGNPQPMQFDKLILSMPLETSGLKFLDLRAEEKHLFDKFSSYRFYNTVCQVQGLPGGVVASIPLNDIKKGEYTGYIKDYEDVPVAMFFSLASKGVKAKTIEEKINEVLSEVPDYKGEKPEAKPLEQKEWHYFPHVEPSAVADNFYDHLEALQGKTHTYYASSALAFECVGNSVAYARRLVMKKF